MADEISDDLTYQVVLNDEEQYSIWREDRQVPEGWRAEGKRGTRAECLEYIDEVWTDMRPLSVRSQLTDGVHAR